MGVGTTLAGREQTRATTQARPQRRSVARTGVFSTNAAESLSGHYTSLCIGCGYVLFFACCRAKHWAWEQVRSASKSGQHTVSKNYPEGDPARSWNPRWAESVDDVRSDIGTPREHFRAFVAARARQGRTAADCQCDATNRGHDAWEDRRVGCTGDPPELRGDTALINSYANNRHTLCRPPPWSGKEQEGSSVTCNFHHSMFTQKNHSASICELTHVAVRMDLIKGELMTTYSSPATPLLLERGAVAAQCDLTADVGKPEDANRRFIGPQLYWLYELLHGIGTQSWPAGCDHIVNHTVLMLSRDNNLNLFHSAEDMLQVYIAAVVLGLDPRRVEFIIGDLVR